MFLELAGENFPSSYSQNKIFCGRNSFSWLIQRVENLCAKSVFGLKPKCKLVAQRDTSKKDLRTNRDFLRFRASVTLCHLRKRRNRRREWSHKNRLRAKNSPPAQTRGETCNIKAILAQHPRLFLLKFSLGKFWQGKRRRGRSFGPSSSGAGGGGRTHTLLPATDFESVSSANSNTPAFSP